MRRYDLPLHTAPPRGIGIFLRTVSEKIRRSLSQSLVGGQSRFSAVSIAHIQRPIAPEPFRQALSSIPTLNLVRLLPCTNADFANIHNSAAAA